MNTPFLIYGANGFVGAAIAHMAVQRGERPILAGRNQTKVAALAAELGLDYRVASLDDPAALDRALADVSAVLHCAGPYLYTYRPMVEACLRAGVHYLDITGEIPVYQALAEYDAQARARGVMLLPGVGFDVVPTDCLAAHLKRRLPSATRLTLAFHVDGPVGLPPGTANTMIELIPHGQLTLRRRAGRLEPGPLGGHTRTIDFGEGPVQTTLFGWGDVFMAYRSTGIPNIEDYLALPDATRGMVTIANLLRPIFALPAARELMKRTLPPGVVGSTEDERTRTRTRVWGEVVDDAGRRCVSRLHGPEAGVVWTGLAALAATRNAADGDAKPGFQTASLAYGPDFALACEGVTREDLE